MREPSHSRGQDIHLGLNPAFSPGLHAYGKPDKMIFCRKRSLLILPPPDPLIGAKPVKLSVAHVAKREDLTGAFVNLRPEAALCLISFQLWKSLSLFGGSTQPKGCQSSVSSCLLWRLMGHIVRLCMCVCVCVCEYISTICVQNSASVVNFVCLWVQEFPEMR